MEVEREVLKERVKKEGAWAAEQLPVVSGIGLTIEKTYLCVTVGVLCCSLQLGWTAQLCVGCTQSAPANEKSTSDKRTRGCTTAKRRDFEKHAKRDHLPP